MKFRTEQDLEDRAVILGEYIIEHKATVRSAAMQINLHHISEYPNLHYNDCTKTENTVFVVL